MVESDKQRFRELMIGIGEVYGKEITRPLLKIYFGSLENISIDDFELGINKHSSDARHGSYMPKPADIRRQIDSITPSSEENAELAWLQIENLIRKKGAYGNLDIPDKQAIAAVKNLGSWKSLCHTDLSKMQWKKKEFLMIYSTLENTPLHMLPEGLPGIEDLANQRVSSESSTIRSLESIKLNLLN